MVHFNLLFLTFNLIFYKLIRLFLQAPQQPAQSQSNLIGMVDLQYDKIKYDDDEMIVLYDKLTTEDFTVIKIHSQMEIKEREQVMQKFKKGARILVSTNFMGRSFDVQQLSIMNSLDQRNNTFIEQEELVDMEEMEKWLKQQKQIELEQSIFYLKRNYKRKFFQF